MRGGLLCLFVVLSLFCGCKDDSGKKFVQNTVLNLDSNVVVEKYKNVYPKKWGEDIDGVVKVLPVKDDEKVLALTLDLCGSKNDSLDEELVAFLEERKIPVTFFVNYRWINKYPEKFDRIYKNPLFEVENHGYEHLPASVSGRSIYHIKGTKNSAELYDEVVKNADFIEKITGRRPKFYRSGTAYYDEYAVAQIYDMGFMPVGFNVLGDAGATYPAWKVKNVLLSAKNGDIIICHANHPEKETGRGLRSVLPMLLDKKFRFVRLDEYLK